MAIIIDLPHQDIIDRSSGPKREGFMVNQINYGAVSQREFQGADAEASREESWTIKWKLLEFRSAAEVAAGAKNTIQEIRDFYKNAQLNHVRWKPFELPTTRIWEVVPYSLRVNNPAGCIFEAQLQLKYLYQEAGGRPT